MPTRSSEASAECFGRVVLSYLRENEQADASFFILGDVLHRAIEDAIKYDRDLDFERIRLDSMLDVALHNLKDRRIESNSRGFDTMYDDGLRMLTNWFNHVHPDSRKRHPIYDSYEWPPAVEVRFYRTDLDTRYPVWGEIDALFNAKAAGHQKMIVDWKSGVKRPNDDFQLNYYRYGLGRPNAPAHYHMLDRVRQDFIVVEAGEFNESEIWEAITLVERRKDAIIKGYMPRFSPDWYCGYCPVQHLCPVEGSLKEQRVNRRQLARLLRKVEGMHEIPEEV